MSKDKFAKFGKSFANAVVRASTIIHDGSRMEQIEKIDKQVAELLQERDHLIADLIDPGDLKPSKNYDPNWRKKTVEDDEPVQTSLSSFSSEGRLTQCEGSWRDNDPFDKSHPGCPYRKTQHINHEFTLRD